MTVESVPLWSLVRPAGVKVTPEDMDSAPEFVEHYAIDELGVTGRPRHQNPGEIASDKLLVQTDDLLVSRLNPRKGHVFEVAEHDVPAIASTEFAVVRPTPYVDRRFVRYVLTSEPTRRLLDSQVRSATKSHGRVDFEAIWSLPVPVPPLEEQRRIADYLDTETARIDTLLTKNEQAAELVQERFVRLRFDLLSGAHRAESRTLIESPWFESRPSSWQDAKLGAVIRLQRGYDLPADDRLDGDVPVVSSGGVIDTHSVAMEEPPGIVTGRYGTIGELYYIEEPYWPLNTALFVKHLWEVEPRFAYWLLQTVPLAFDSDKSAVTGINRNVIHDVRVPLPPRSEQSGIAERLDEALERRDDLLESLRHQRVLLNERRQALITAVVTGEIEV